MGKRAQGGCAVNPGQALRREKVRCRFKRYECKPPSSALSRRSTETSGSLARSTKGHKWGCAVYPGQALHKERVQSRFKRHECRPLGTVLSSKPAAAYSDTTLVVNKRARIRLCRISGTSPAQDLEVKKAPPCFLRFRKRTKGKNLQHECKRPSSALSCRPTATLSNSPRPPQVS
jgi:hypothetical protein